ncbi:MAG: hypothetical protein JXN59_07970, partial [Anaerolineae bacterium]|nr:hypothetical protein [Anaerolineae bacterium]
PSSPNAAAWIDAYTHRFREIVDRYRDRIFVYEAINEPNGWQGGDRALVHPRWFVHMMNTLYTTLKPRERGIRLVSAPLEATWVNHNEAANYLNTAYQIGGWAPGRAPWDGIGYHLYIGEDPGAPQGTDGSVDPDDIRDTYKSFLNKMWSVINYHDPETRHLLFVSEFGWTSDLGEDYQARQIQLGMELLGSDDRVALASLFCAEDFSKKYGLYVEGMGRAKQAFTAFQSRMRTLAPNRSQRVDFTKLEGPVDVPVVEPPEGDSWPWSTGPGLMKHPVEKRAVILLPPFDNGEWGRAVLDAGYHGQGGVTVTWSPGEAGLTIAGEERVVLVVNPAEWDTPDGSMVPWFRENTPGVKVREETFLKPEVLRDWLKSNPNLFDNVQ